jgi:hypothetical protein
MTGTEGSNAGRLVQRGAVPDAVTGDIREHQSASSCNLRVVGAISGDGSQSLEMQGAGADLHRPASTCTSTPVGTRTRNIPLRRRVLYPVELRARWLSVLRNAGIGLTDPVTIPATPPHTQESRAARNAHALRPRPNPTSHSFYTRRAGGQRRFAAGCTTSQRTPTRRLPTTRNHATTCPAVGPPLPGTPPTA